MRTHAVTGLALLTLSGCVSPDERAMLDHGFTPEWEVGEVQRRCLEGRNDNGDDVWRVTYFPTNQPELEKVVSVPDYIGTRFGHQLQIFWQCEGWQGCIEPYRIRNLDTKKAAERPDIFATDVNAPNYCERYGN